MKELKEKGITLVALVVTVIILLILAGVTINIALSKNGLFRRARESAKGYKNVSKNEIEILDNLDKTLAELSGETGGIGSSDIARNLKEYQGKYVDIGLDTNGNSQVDDWEIFYAGNGRIFLIAADYVTTSKLESWNVIGSGTTLNTNGFDQTLGTYNVYWSTPKTFLRLPDLNVVMHTGYSLDNNKINPNSIAVSHLLNTDAWSGIKKAAGKNASIDFVIGGPTLEMWCAAWNKAVEGDGDFVEINPEPDTSGYKVKTSIVTDSWLYMDGTQTELGDKLTTLGEKYKTFFPHTESSSYNDCNGYWLASPSAFNSSRLVHIYCRGGLMANECSNCDACVRPVVALASGVKIEETGEKTGKYKIVLTSGQN